MKRLGTETAADDRGQGPSFRWALASLALCALLPALGSSIANVALPTWVEAFEAPFHQVQWVLLSYLLAITGLIVGVGRMGDLAGRRRLLLGGILVFTAASLLCAAASDLRLLIAARALQGLGAAAMMALSLAFVGEMVPRTRTGSAMGLLGALSAAGTALGPSLGGVLIARFGWPSIFLLNVPLGILALTLAWRGLPLDRRSVTARPGRFDRAGMALLALSLGAYALAMTARPAFGPANLTLLLLAVLGGALFVRTERRAPSPLIRLAGLRDPALSTGLAMSALVSTVVMSTLVIGPFYLGRTLGLDMARVGLVMSAGPVAAALGGVLAGRLVDRLGTPRMTRAGLVAMLVGCTLLCLTPVAAGIGGYVMPIVVLTTGYALFQTANNTAVMGAASAHERGVVSGMLTLSRNLGLITGASAMGTVLALGAQARDFATAAPDAIAQGMRLSFALAAVLILVALVVARAGRARPALAGAPLRSVQP